MLFSLLLNYYLVLLFILYCEILYFSYMKTIYVKKYLKYKHV